MSDGRTTRLTAEAATFYAAARGAITFGSEVFTPDSFKAYVEFRLSHGFPVITTDRTAMHPAVVEKTYRSLLHQVFNLGHIMKSHDAVYAHDRVVGSVVAVEFPKAPKGGWKVQSSREKAPGIRGCAVMHKAADGVPTILEQHLTGKLEWTVSMEVTYFPEQSGFLVGRGVDVAFARAKIQTPDDIAALGYDYVPWGEAGPQLRNCWDEDTGAMKEEWAAADLYLLLGGLDGDNLYRGVGLCPAGKEAEAAVMSMVAALPPEDNVFNLLTNLIRLI
jgi:hypothetical protein